VTAAPKSVPWDRVEREQLTPLLQRQFFSTSQLTVARFELKKGCVVPEHHHHNEQVTSVFQGALKLSFSGQEVTVRAGETISIPPNLRHSAEALEDTLVIDVFTPPRRDWEQKQDAYLRQQGRG
jgi:quercetin dioxygenase-like cupin family protein